MQAVFQIKVKVHWNASGNVQVLDSSLEEDMEDDDDDDEDDDEDEDQGKFLYGYFEGDFVIYKNFF